MTTRRHQHCGEAGVTMIELIVVIGIVAVVSLVVIFNYSNFSTNVSIRNLAQDIALSVRKAQSYATSVQSLPGGSTSSYPAYGIAFSLADPTPYKTVPSKKQFVLFADKNNNGVYDYPANSNDCNVPSDPTNECIESFTITTADSIVQLVGAASRAVAIFCRPSPDAAIYADGVGSPGCSNTTISNLKIGVQSAKGITQWIQLWNTGQLSVQ